MLDRPSSAKLRYEFDKDTADEKFPGYFQLKPVDSGSATSSPSDPSDEYFVEFVRSKLRTLKALSGDGSDQSQKLLKARDECAVALKKDAAAFLESGNALETLEAAAGHWGAFEAFLDVLQALPRWEVKRDANGLAYDFDDSCYTTVATKLVLNEEQQKLIVDVMTALTVVKTVLRSKSGLIDRAISLTQASRIDPERNYLALRRDQYVTRLAKITEVGLLPEQASFAKLFLASFKDDFVSLEADRVKNQYVKSLGFHAILWGAIFAAIWFVVPPAYQNGLAPYLVLAIGACGGTWLSFALRRVVLGFTDLALLEEDRMNPSGRILFVVGLTCIVGMLIQTGLVKLSFNDVKIELKGEAPIALGSGMLLLLIGTLCGIAERALAGTVSARADTFVKSLDVPPSKATKAP